ncbi:MAG: Gldg family protein [Planctomycetes bacterium]|nr:Gldg family protein [Planctomycetota bacterium]
MNKNAVLAVARRDLRSWFGNPAGYVFILLFVGVSCVAWMWSPQFFGNNLANLDTWNDQFAWIAPLFLAAATMGMWANERANGTQELLFTLPATDFDLQLGKFLAYVGVWTIALAFTLVMPAALVFFGNPDWGQLFANYVGFWLFGTMLVAVSMIGSQLTNNGTVAFIASTILCFAVVWFDLLMGWLGLTSWSTNGPRGQFDAFARGMLPVSGFVLFLGLTIAFFQLSLALLARRHWRLGEEGVHGGLRFAGLAVSALALTVIAVHKLPRLDATFEGIHSLGDESKKLLASLDPNRQVVVTAYVTEDMPEQFVQQKSLLLNLLDQFDSIGGNAVEKRIVMPEPFSPEARTAEQNYGIRAQPVQTQLPGGGVVETQVFLGFVVQCGTEEIVNPFVEPAVPLEYELTRSIRVVSKASRRKIGVLKTDLEMNGGFDMQTFRQKPKWSITDELEQQYKVESVDADKDYPDGLDCLVVPQPSSLVQEQMNRLQAYVLAGHPTLVLEDPMPMDQLAQGTAADDPKGGMQARMMGGGGPEKGNVAGLFGALGVQFAMGEIVWDLSVRKTPFARGASDEFLFLSGPALAADSPITKGLQTVVVLMGGHLQAQSKEGFTMTPLLVSPGPLATRQPNGVVRKRDLFQSDLFGSRFNPNARREQRNGDLVVAARVRSKAADDKQKAVDCIVVADVDFVSNQFFQIRRQYVDPNLRFDNVTFVLNCIDSLVGDESLIELRKRRPVLRKLEAVEKSQEAFEKKWTQEKDAAEAAASAALDKAQGALDDAVRKITDDNTLDDQAKDVKIARVQALEQRRLDIEKAKIEDQKKRALEEATHERDSARRGVHDRYRLLTLALAILPGLALGVLTWRRRASRAAAIVPANRRAMKTGGVQ